MNLLPHSRWSIGSRWSHHNFRLQNNVDKSEAPVSFMMQLMGLANFEDDVVCDMIRECYVQKGYEPDIVKWIGVTGAIEGYDFEKHFDKSIYKSFFRHNRLILKKAVVLLLVDDDINIEKRRSAAIYPYCSSKRVGEAIDEASRLCVKYHNISELPKDAIFDVSSDHVFLDLALKPIEVIISLLGYGV